MRISIRTKSILLTILLIILVSVTISYFFIRAGQTLVVSQHEEKGVILSTNLAYNAEYGVLTGNMRMLDNLASGIMDQPDVLYCAVRNMKGEVLVAREQEGIEKELLPVPQIKEKATGLDKPLIRRVKVDSEKSIDISAFVLSKAPDISQSERDLFLEEEEWFYRGRTPEEAGPAGSKAIGVINLGISLKSADALIRETEYTAARITVVLTLVLIIISSTVVTLVLRPVRQLVDATNEVAKGDLDVRVPARTSDEVGELATSFNKMAEELKKSTVSIKVLQDAEKRFQDITKNVGDWVWEVDPGGRYTYSSSVSEKVIGYKPEQVIGKHFSDFFPEDQKEELTREINEMIDKREKFSNYVNPLVNKKGEVVKVETNALPVFDEEGELAGYRGVDRDITERERVKEAQRLTQLGKLVSDMAHEVNNPLMVISGRAQISLMEQPKNDVINESLSIIMDQCYRAKNIIERLLLFSRPSKKQMKEVDINEAVNFAMQMLEHQMGLKDIKVDTVLDETIPHVQVDEKQMHEIFVNLIRNAADAMPEGGQLTITTSLKGDNIWIDFKDTGIGISEEDMQKIFDPFFTTKDHGTGLGLSVCYGIIKAHGGEMKYSSTPGKGTTATVILPVS
ncbi:MAG: PAS domain S-box protein [Candidatus Omnitrophica bacterium]|nr:PAS domain S-box protein [Candidatus Omnitrophota bacterium]